MPSPPTKQSPLTPCVFGVCASIHDRMPLSIPRFYSLPVPGALRCAHKPPTVYTYGGQSDETEVTRSCPIRTNQRQTQLTRTLIPLSHTSSPSTMD